MTNFVSVTTNSARYQELSLNPQKLAGQCSKLKCCLNYELDVYLDAQEDFPDTSIRLETKQGKASHQKTDVFKRLMWYSMPTEHAPVLTCLSIDNVKEIIEMNKEGKQFTERTAFIFLVKMLTDFTVNHMDCRNPCVHRPRGWRKSGKSASPPRRGRLSRHPSASR